MIKFWKCRISIIEYQPLIESDVHQTGNFVVPSLDNDRLQMY